MYVWSGYRDVCRSVWMCMEEVYGERDSRPRCGCYKNITPLPFFPTFSFIFITPKNSSFLSLQTGSGSGDYIELGEAPIPSHLTQYPVGVDRWDPIIQLSLPKPRCPHKNPIPPFPSLPSFLNLTLLSISWELGTVCFGKKRRKPLGSAPYQNIPLSSSHQVHDFGFHFHKHLVI